MFVKNLNLGTDPNLGNFTVSIPSTYVVHKTSKIRKKFFIFMGFQTLLTDRLWIATRFGFYRSKNKQIVAISSIHLIPASYPEKSPLIE